MATISPVYNGLNKAWKSTCKILFGEEIGDLREYEGWLKRFFPNLGIRKSHISGEKVYLLMPDYCKDANFITANEIKESVVDPLTINEIKDIDSIIEAISEKWEYAGNKILGNSTFVESSDMIFDSHFVSDSIYAYNSAYIYGVAAPMDCKYIFGGGGIKNSEFLLQFFGGTNVRRCFEGFQDYDSSDLFFCISCLACNDLIFSFNQRNKRYMIGNLQLPRDKYLSAKSKLLGEIKEKLERDKEFPSVFELIPNEKSNINIKIRPSKTAMDIVPIEKAYSSTFKILFKKETSGIAQYEKWLSRYFPLPKETISPFGQNVYLHRIREFSKMYPHLPERRAVGEEESLELENLHLNEHDIGSLSKIKEKLGEIAYICMHITEGNVRNRIKTPIAYDSSNVYKMTVAVLSEYAAVNCVGISSKYIFGSDRLNDSHFCIHCYYSSKLTRCFEVDTSINCSDTYFAHNCEGLNDAMFCFNAKAKRYAIGNSQLPPEKYRILKDSLVEQMSDEILKKKELKWDIFNVGCGFK